MENIKTKVIARLEEVGARYDINKEKTDSLKIEDQVESKGMQYREGMSTLIFKTEKGKYVCVLRRDDRKLDMKKFKSILGAKHLEYLKEEELNLLGYEKGLLSPIALPEYVDLFVEHKVLEMNRVICGVGEYGYYLETNKDDLLKALKDYSVVEVSVPNEQRADQDLDKEITSIVSGVTPSGNMLHIGNYYGAVKNNIEYGNSIDEAYVFIADLHALTTIKNRDQLENNILNVVIDYLALGLDPEKAIFFRQSDVAQHSQLAVVLGNYVSYGQMQRMHAFKDKLAKGTEIGSINMGLFNYPILMAADILLYRPDGVPVGEDQRQHIELARDIAENFNKSHGDYFPLPEPLIAKDMTAKVIGTDGERKMSKSLGNYVGIFEDEEVIKNQIMKAYTDPNRIKATDPGQVEGNTVFMYHDLINDNKEEVAELKKRYEAGTVGDVEVKEKLLAAHQRMFGPARERRKELESNLDYVRGILAEGAEKAKDEASKNLKEIYELIGLD